MHMKNKQSESTSTTLALTVNFVTLPGYEDFGLEYEGLAREIFTLCFAYTGLLAKYNVAEITIKISDDAEVMSLNTQFRGKNAPTNVLSFPSFEMRAGEFESDSEPYDGYLGDIIISLETISQEANEQGKSLKNHYAHMLCHGILHLLGYDHINDDDASVMEQIEIELLHVLKIPNPYQ